MSKSLERLCINKKIATLISEIFLKWNLSYTYLMWWNTKYKSFTSSCNETAERSASLKYFYVPVFVLRHILSISLFQFLSPQTHKRFLLFLRNSTNVSPDIYICRGYIFSFNISSYLLAIWKLLNIDRISIWDVTNRTYKMKRNCFNFFSLMLELYLEGLQF